MVGAISRIRRRGHVVVCVDRLLHPRQHPVLDWRRTAAQAAKSRPPRRLSYRSRAHCRPSGQWSADDYDLPRWRA